MKSKKQKKVEVPKELTSEKKRDIKSILISTEKTPSVPALDVLTNKIRNARDLSFADEVFKAKRQNPWRAIELIVEAWATKKPKQFAAYDKYIGDTRENLADKKYGLTKDSSRNGRVSDRGHDRRLKLIMPVDVERMIRVVFNTQELVMDKEFFDEFARRFPFFKIPEKL